MIVSQFLLWARHAPPGQRAEAVSALARAYLVSDLSPRDRWEAETALTAMLDDPAALVRRAMAEVFASSPDAPRHIVLALAGDASEIAALVLARSPLFADGDLVDGLALGDERIQAAIATRADLSAGLCAALAEIGAPIALEALASNHGVDIPEAALLRMVERHGNDALLREAILRRPVLPLPVQQAVAAALAAALEGFVVRCGWLSGERSQRVVREARDRTAVSLSAEAVGSDVARLVSHLRAAGHLTPALILRAVLSGAAGFAEAAFAELTDGPVRRLSAILAAPHSGPFRSLYAKAGLPPSLRPAFAAALAARRAGPSAAPGPLCRRTVARALAACEDLPEEADRLVALLRRFDSEAVRDEARLAAQGLADDAALTAVLRWAPQELAGPDTSSLAA